MGTVEGEGMGVSTARLISGHQATPMPLSLPRSSLRQLCFCRPQGAKLQGCKTPGSSAGPLEVSPSGLGPSRQSREASWGEALLVSLNNSMSFSGPQFSIHRSDRTWVGLRKGMKQSHHPFKGSYSWILPGICIRTIGCDISCP